MRVGRAVKLVLMLGLALSFVFAPGLVPVPAPAINLLGNQGITVASAVAGYSSLYSVRNLSESSASYLHDFASASGTHYYSSPSDITAGGSQIYFARDISDSTLPSGLYTLTVNSDQDLSALFIGNESTAGPTTGIASPTDDSSDAGVPITFTAYYMDGRNTTSSSGQYLDGVYLAVRGADSGLANALYLKYDVVNNKVYLRNDLNTAWLGGYAPGTNNVIRNSQGAVLVGASTRTWSTNKRLLTMEWSVVFRGAYAGDYNLYTCATESTDGTCATQSADNGGWSSKGAWTVNPLAVSTLGVQPNSGTSGIYDAILFETSYEDTNEGGAADIASAEFQINPTSPLTPTAITFLGRYVPATNEILVYNDGDWSSGYTPGSSETPDSGYFTLDVANTTVISAGNALTVTWAVVPQGIRSGYQLYLRAVGASGETDGWSDSYGTRNVTYRSVPVTATQESTTSSLNRTHVITTVYSDTTTTDNIGRSYLVMTPTTTGAPFWAYYDQPSSTFYLRDGATWLAATRGVTETVENDYFRLYADATEVITEGTNLTIDWAIRPTSATKTYNLYLGASDTNDNFSGLRSGFGSWTVSPDRAPTTGALSPSSGNSNVGEIRTFTAVYGDLDGADDLSRVGIELRSAGVRKAAVLHDLGDNSTQINGRIAGTWVVGGAPGTAEVIENDNFRLDLASTEVISAGNVLTVTWAIQPLGPAVNKSYTLHLYAQDASNVKSASPTLNGWSGSKGSWFVNYRAVPVSLSPSSLTSSKNNSQTLTAVYTDTGTYDDIARAGLAVTPGSSPAASALDLQAYYEQDTGTYYVLSRTEWLSGTTGTLANAAFSLDIDATTSSIVTDTDSLTIGWSVTPVALASGRTFRTFLRAADADLTYTPWTYKGTWKVVANLAPTTGAVSPDSGNSDVGEIRTFTAVYGDPDGALDLSRVGIELRSAGVRKAAILYNLGTNDVSFTSRISGVWQRAGAPGTAEVYDNGTFAIDLASTEVISAGNVLTVTWAIQPLGPAVNKSYTAHLYAQDTSNAKSASPTLNGWSGIKGRWFVNYRALPVSLSPTSLTSSKNNAQTLTAVYTDTGRYDDIARAGLAVTPGSSPAASALDLQAYYEQDAGTYYVLSRTEWLSGTTGTLANAAFSLDLDATTSSIVTDTDSLTIGWSVTPVALASGRTFRTFLRAADADLTYTPWTYKGTWRVVANQAPTTGALSPDSGNSDVGEIRTFTAVYGDLDSALDLSRVGIELRSAGVRKAAILYNLGTNDVSITSRISGVWQRVGAPGTAEVYDNGTFAVDLASTEVISAGNVLTVTWAIQPLGPAVNKSYTAHLYAQDTSNAKSASPTRNGWSGIKGRWFVNYRAVPVSLSPSSLSSVKNIAQTLTAVYTDTGTYDDIARAGLAVTPGSSPAARDFLAYYDQSIDTYFVYSQSEWISGTTGSLANASFSLDIDETAANVVPANGDGGSLTIGWSVTPLGPASGKTFKTFLQAADADLTSTPWTLKGTWTISANHAPTTGDLSPSSGRSDVGEIRTFTAVYGDPDGALDLSRVGIELRSAGVRKAAILYNLGTNDASITSRISGVWQRVGAPGTAEVYDNGTFAVDLASTEVISAGNVLTVTWAIQPLGPAVNKTYTMHLFAQDTSNAKSASPTRNGWSGIKGRWFVNYRALPISLAPSSGTSSENHARTLTAVYTDTGTYDDIAQAWLAVSPGTSPAATALDLQAYYEQSTGTYYVLSRTQWLSDTAGTLSNAAFRLDIDATTVVTGTDSLTIDWSITPLASAGTATGRTFNAFLKAADGDLTTSPWVKKGTWKVVDNQAPAPGTVTPSSGSSTVGATRVFTTTFSDADGADDLSYVLFRLKQTAPSSGAGTYTTFKYNVISDTLSIATGAGDFSDGVALGTTTTISNTVLSLDAENTTVSLSGNVLTVAWAVTPLTPGKTYYLYRQAVDLHNKATSLAYGGTWRTVALPSSAGLSVPGLPSIQELAAAFFREGRLI